MPAENSPRRITIINVPYNYHFKDRSAVICYRETGEYMVKGEIADHATSSGYAIEGWASDSKTRTTKGKTSRRKSVKPAVDAGANNRTDAGMVGTGVPTSDSSGIRSPVGESSE